VTVISKRKYGHLPRLIDNFNHRRVFSNLAHYEYFARRLNLSIIYDFSI
jgi:hypothetical protein